MLNLREDAVRTFGAEWTAALEANAGVHAYGAALSALPASGDERLIYGFLEAVDFGCPDYHWACPGRSGPPSGVTLEALIRFLREHRAEIIAANLLPPSWLGVLSGAFDFLSEEGQASLQENVCPVVGPMMETSSVETTGSEM